MSSRSMVLSVLFTLFCLGGAHAASEESSSQKALREHYDLQEGKRLYEQYCRFCHGEQGKGKAFDVTPPPADLTSPAVQQKSDFDLTQIIHGGEQGTAMGAWKWTLSDRDKQNVLRYIRSLAQ
ncbi:c-type cytochrome [Candidatus Nitrospira nitrificans]|uniref:Putative Cytochrome c553 n=1 Tax=Candidatus Nitrospira nitrificans TaxID=1742973 RepID=A0A0S4LBQ7_9BACT|nr:cytochrome c [Candidatus Nitrospira nitrificans]CUS35169.1 putative Cytochrome c553 [Candidatus Nitrospira nitrificans]